MGWLEADTATATSVGEVVGPLVKVSVGSTVAKLLGFTSEKSPLSVYNVSAAVNPFRKEARATRSSDCKAPDAAVEGPAGVEGVALAAGVEPPQPDAASTIATAAPTTTMRETGLADTSSSSPTRSWALSARE